MEGDAGGVSPELSASAAIREHLEQAHGEVKSTLVDQAQKERKEGEIPGEYLDSCCSLAFPFLLLIGPNQHFC